MSERIEPALTAEEWKNYLTSGGGQIDPNVQTSYFGTPQRIAAYCLYGQPFGFTREDVSALRTAVSEIEDGLLEYGTSEQLRSVREGTNPGLNRLKSLIARIEALLPETS